MVEIEIREISMITSREITDTSGNIIGFGVGVYPTKNNVRELLEFTIESNISGAFGAGFSLSVNAPFHFILQLGKKIVSVKLFGVLSEHQ